MTETRTFDLTDVLTITTGELVSSRHMDGVFDILNYMTGDNLYTHQLPHAIDECKPYLLKQHPFLSEADEVLWRVFGGELGGKAGVDAFMAICRTVFPSTLPVEPLPDGVHQKVSPLSRLAMDPHQDVIVVQVPSEMPK